MYGLKTAHANIFAYKIRSLRCFELAITHVLPNFSEDLKPGTKYYYDSNNNLELTDIKNENEFVPRLSLSLNVKNCVIISCKLLYFFVVCFCKLKFCLHCMDEVCPETVSNEIRFGLIYVTGCVENNSITKFSKMRN